VCDIELDGSSVPKIVIYYNIVAVYKSC
jgi:hypothetical protein